MALSNDLISQFVKATRDKEKPNTESTAYGKIVVHDGKEYVQLDGSELLTPISSTIIVKEGDRVIVTIKDHTAIVTGDFTNPSANNKDVTEIGNKISEFEIVIADKVTTKQLEAEMARIEELRVEDLKAINAEFETINAEVAKIEKIEADQIEISGKVEAHEAEFTTLRADIADFKDVTAESVKAVEGKFNTLEADYTSFEETTTNKLTAYEANIKDLEADMLTAEKADLKYANIDFSNIKEAAIEKLFTDSGIIKDLIMSNGKVTGELVGVTIKGDLIEGNTVKADKLVILGEDGLYYKLNVDALGETTASADPKYQNGLDGSVIIAESITAEKIAVDDLVAFGATIGGFNINDHAIYSGAKAGIDSNNEGVFISDDGQINIGDTNQYLKYFKDSDGNYKLEILADSLKFGANKTTIEEYIESKTENISTIKEAEGSELYINDGQQLIEFRVDGKSEQETRSGKNLFDGLLELGSFNSTGENVINENCVRTVNYIEVKPNTKYTISNDLGYQSVVMFYDENKNFLHQVTTNSLDISSDVKYIKWRSSAGNVENNLNVKYMLEEGPVATEYEQPGASPSPDYPSEIVSLGYENLFKESLTADDGTIIKVNHADVVLEDDVFVFTCKNSTDLYFGQVASIDKPYNGTLGNLIDVTGLDSISYNISNKLFTKNYVSYYDENLIGLKVAAYNTHKGTINLKYAPVGTKYITFRFGHSPATIGEVYRTTVQINKGDRVLPHVPNNKYGIEIKRIGENLLDLLDGTYSASGITAVVSNGTITLNGTATATAFISITTNSYYDISDGEKFTVSAINPVANSDIKIRVNDKAYYDTGLSTVNHAATYTKESVNPLIGNKLQIRIQNGVTLTNYVIKPMLKKGLPSEYQPYKCQSTLLLLNEPLRSLPNGIKDIAYIKNSKLYVDRKVGTVVLDGNEGWGEAGTQYDGLYSCYITYPAMKRSNDFNSLLSNNFKVNNFYTQEEGITKSQIPMNYDFIIFRISRDKATTIKEFESWLSEHPTQVDYELTESITEEIGYVDLSMTENSVNDYSVNDPMSPNLYCKYYKDGVLIDDTIAEEFKNINNNLINNYYTKTEVDTQFKVTTDSITASVSEIKKQQENTDSSVEALDKDIVELSKTVSAKMTSEEVTIAIQNELANGVSHVKTSTGFTFNEEGLTVSKDGRDMKTTINEDGMIIKSVNAILEEEDKLIANSDGVFAYDLRAKTYLIIGANSRFEDYEKNGKKQTGCFWIGDTEV